MHIVLAFGNDGEKFLFELQNEILDLSSIYGYNSVQAALFLMKNSDEAMELLANRTTDWRFIIQQATEYVANNGEIIFENVKASAADINNFHERRKPTTEISGDKLSFQIGVGFGSSIGSLLVNSIVADDRASTFALGVISTVGRTLVGVGRSSNGAGAGAGSALNVDSWDWGIFGAGGDGVNSSTVGRLNESEFVSGFGIGALAGAAGAGASILASRIGRQVFGDSVAGRFATTLVSTAAGTTVSYLVKSLFAVQQASLGTQLADAGISVAASYAGTLLGEALFGGIKNQDAAEVINFLSTAATIFFGSNPVTAFAIAFLSQAIGSLFQPELPEGSVSLTYNPDHNRFDFTHWYARHGQDLGDTIDIGAQTADLVNGLLTEIGGTVINGEAVGIRIGVRQGDEFFSLINNVKRSFSNPLDALTDGVIRGLKQLQIEGGDIYVKRALLRTDANDLESFDQDLALARQYSQYRASEEVFMDLLAQEPNGDEIMQSMIVRARQLRLDVQAESDTYTRSAFVDELLQAQTSAEAVAAANEAAPSQVVATHNSNTNTYQNQNTYDPGDYGSLPIILDLDNSGTFEVVNFENSGFKYDITGTGTETNVSWVTGGDAFLVFDDGNDGVIENRDELVLAAHAEAGADEFQLITDLDGLRTFDSNDDGKLTSADTHWSKFKAWSFQDGDTDTSDGVLQTLDALNITEIDLSDDGPDSFQNLDGATVLRTGSYVQNGVTRKYADTVLEAAQEGLLQTAGNDALVSHSGGELTFFGSDDLPDDPDGAPLLTNDHHIKLETREVNRTDSLGNFAQDMDTIGVDGTSFDAAYGGIGNDCLEGGARGERISGGAGTDTLFGGAGDDLIIFDIDDIAGLGTDTDASGVDDGLEDLNSNGTLDGLEDTNSNGIQDRLENVNGGDGLDVGVFDGDTDLDLDIADLGFEGLFGGDGDDSLKSGTAGQGVILQGLAGDDTLEGNSANDRLDGGSGEDCVTGGAGDDILRGGAGEDTIYGGAGDDILVVDADDRLIDVDGGEGLDVVLVDDPRGAIVDLAEVNAEMAFGGVGGDLLLTTGDEAISASGQGGDDALKGGAGDDTLDGGADNDLIAGGAGADIIDGGAGSDTAVYAESGSAVTIDLSTGAAEGGDAEGDTLSGIENLVGSDHDDLLIGDSESNQLEGGVGRDTLESGAGGENVLDGGQDDDVYRVSRGSTAYILDGYWINTSEEQQPTVNTYTEEVVVPILEEVTFTREEQFVRSYTSPSTTAINGPDGIIGYRIETRQVFITDTREVERSRFEWTVETFEREVSRIDFPTLNADDLVRQNGGDNDVLELGEGIASADLIFHALEGALMVGVRRAGSLFGAADTIENSIIMLDWFETEATVETLVLADGTSLSLTAVYEDAVAAGRSGAVEGDLNITWIAGSVALVGGDGADSIVGGVGDDTIAGGAGADTLDGGLGENTISFLDVSSGVSITLDADGQGSATGQVIHNFQHAIGSVFSDTITGDETDNLVAGAGGADSLEGGAGTDTLDYRHSTAGVSVNLGDTLAEAGGDADGDTVSGFENLIGSAHDDVLVGDSLTNEIVAGAGDDSVGFSAGNDSIYGGSGFDTFTIDGDLTTFTIRNGLDAIYVEQDGTSNVSRLSGFETIILDDNQGNVSEVDVATLFDAVDGQLVVKKGHGASIAATFENAQLDVNEQTGVTLDATWSFTGSISASLSGDSLGGTLDSLSAAGTGQAQVDVTDTVAGVTDRAVFDVEVTEGDEFSGGAGNDTLIGGADAETFNGHGGRDTIEAGSGDDTIFAGDGADVVIDGAGSDSIDLGFGDDTLVWDGADTVGSASDSVFGGFGFDVVDLGASADFDYEIDNVTGNVVLTATGIAGTLVLEGVEALDMDSLSEQIDISDLVDATVGKLMVEFDGSAGQISDFTAQISALNIGEGEQVRVVGAGVGNTALPSGWSVNSDGSISATNVNTTDATISLEVGSSPDGTSFSGRTETFDLMVLDVTNSENFEETTIDGATVRLITGSGGDDTILATDAVESFDGQDGNDRIEGAGGNDTIFGGGGDDILTGGLGTDHVYGDFGDDLIHATANGDSIFGGLGVDTVSFNGYIEDFDTGSETIEGLDIVIGENQVTVSDGVGASDTLEGVEVLKFLDGEVSVFDFATAEDGQLIAATSTDDFEFTLLGNDADGAVFGLENASNGVISVTSGIYKLVSSGLASGDIIATVSVDEGSITLVEQVTISVESYEDSLNALDTLDGGDGSDTILGTGDAQVIDAGAGDDLILGTGNDSMGAVLAGDSIDGGAGQDTISYATAAASSGVEVKLFEESGKVANSTHTDTLESFEHVVGSAGDDTLIGSLASNDLRGGDGDDAISGGSGADSLFGGAGADSLYGDDGDDILAPGAGDSVTASELYGGEGIDLISLEDQSGATLDLSQGSVSLGGGTVTFEGVEGAIGSDGIDSLTGDDRGNIFLGGDGADELYGGLGSDTLHGESGADSLFGGMDDDALSGGDGNDTLDGAEGADHLIGGEGNDSLVGDSGVSSLAGNDTLFGGEGADHLSGLEGDDYLDGGEGNDDLFGGDGDDRLSGGGGADSIVGGAGNDVVDYSALNTAITTTTISGGFHIETTVESVVVRDTVTGIEGIVGTDFADVITGDAGDNLIEGGAGGDNLSGGGGSDTLSYAGSAEGVSVVLGGSLSGGDAADDTVSGFENLEGGFGNDTLTGDGSANELFGGAGDDCLTGGLEGGNSTAGLDVYYGGDGDDTIVLDNWGETVYGGDGRDMLSFENLNYYAQPELHNDRYTSAYAVIFGVVEGIEELRGSAHGDNLYGDSMDNHLEGIGGNDFLQGAEGDDYLDGGDGDDTVYGGDGDDTVIATNSWHSYGSNGALSGGAEHLYGGNGIDLIDLSNVSQDVIYHSRYRNFEIIQGSGHDDSLVGWDWNETITGGAGNDTLIGNDGDDVLVDGVGDSSIDGGLGHDAVDYSGSATGVNANLATGSATSSEFSDTLTSIEKVIGSANKDTITGSSSADEFVAGAGDDSLVGGAGADTITGGDGQDTLDYSGSSAGVNLDLEGLQFDEAYTGTGGDAEGDIVTEVEHLTGSGFDDTLRGDEGANILIGGAGQDIIEGGDGADVLDGGAGTDAVSYQNSSGAVHLDLATQTASGGHASGDTLTGFEAAEGSAHEDTLLGDSLGNIFDGMDGDDVLEGREGADTINGGTGVDRFVLTGDGDSVDGGIGSNYQEIAAEIGLLASGDVADYSGVDEAVTVNLGTGTGELTDTASSGGVQDTLLGIEDVIGTSHNDVMTGDTIGGDEALPYQHTGNRLDGCDGNDIISGLAGDDTLIGGNGSDTLHGGADIDTASYLDQQLKVDVDLSSGSANTYSTDTTQSAVVDVDSLAGIENIEATAFDDTLNGDAAANLLDGVAGADSIDGGDGDDTLIGDLGDDTLNGEAGADSIDGGSGDDSIDGGLAADTIDAGAGDDFIVGGFGDLIDGGSGQDTVKLTGASGDYVYRRNGNTVLVHTIVQGGTALELKATLEDVETLTFDTGDDVAVGDIEEVQDVVAFRRDGQEVSLDLDKILNLQSGETVTSIGSLANVILSGSSITVEDVNSIDGVDTLTLEVDRNSGPDSTINVKIVSLTAVQDYMVHDSASGDQRYSTIGEMGEDGILVGWGDASSQYHVRAFDHDGNAIGDSHLALGSVDTSIVRMTGRTDDSVDLYWETRSTVTGVPNTPNQDSARFEVGTEHALANLDSQDYASYGHFTQTMQYLGLDDRGYFVSRAQGEWQQQGPDDVQGTRYRISFHRHDAETWGNLYGKDLYNVWIANGPSHVAPDIDSETFAMASQRNNGTETTATIVGVGNVLGTTIRGQLITNASTSVVLDVAERHVTGNFELRVAAFDDGSFAFVWSAHHQYSLVGSDPTPTGVFMQRYDDQGSKVGGVEILFDSESVSPAEHTRQPVLVEVVRDPDGNHRAIWFESGDGTEDFPPSVVSIDLGTDGSDPGTAETLTVLPLGATHVSAELLANGGLAIGYAVPEDGSSNHDVFVRVIELDSEIISVLGNPGSDAAIAGEFGSLRELDRSGDNHIIVTGGLTSGDTLFGGDGDDTLSADGDGDNIDGGEGFDFVSYKGGSTVVTADLSTGSAVFDGGSSVDTLTAIEGVIGSAANDVIGGSTGHNALLGGAGDDSLTGLRGRDTLLGEAGDDTIDGGVGHDILQGGDGADSLIGGDGHDNLSGGDGADTLFGGDGYDTLDGGAGNDSIVGDNSTVTGGNDFFVYNSGNDTLDGGLGRDTADYSEIEEDILVDLVVNPGGFSNSLNILDNPTTAIEGDNLTSIEVLMLGSGNDDFRGSNGSDTAYGGDGADVISDRSGDDEMYGGKGDDTLIIHEGDDKYYGGDGRDLLRLNITSADSGGLVDLSAGTATFELSPGVSGWQGNNVVNGFEDVDGTDFTTFGDTLTGDGDGNHLRGLQGEDQLFGGQGDDTLDGGDQDDSITGGAGADLLTGGNGSDTFFLSDGDGTDTITDFDTTTDKIDLTGYSGVYGFGDLTIADIGNGDSRVSFGGVDLFIVSGVAASALSATHFEFIPTTTGTTGADSLTGTNAREALVGLDGNDTLTATGGDDVVDGGSGDDFAYGGSGNDVLFGGDGDDHHYDGTGDDTVLAGDGDDSAWVYQGNDSLDGGAGVDDWLRYQTSAATDGGATVNLATGYSNGIGFGKDTVSGFEHVTGTNDHGDTLIGSGEGNKLHGYGGDDYLAGGMGDDFLYDGDGNDHVDAGLGDDNVYAYAGSDILIGGLGQDTLRYNTHDGAVDANLTTGRVNGGALGIDSVSSFEYFIGSSYADTVTGTAGDETIDGGTGNDVLLSREGADRIYGSGGDDLIDGGSGADLLYGGAGSDTVSYAGSSSGVNVSLGGGWQYGGGGDAEGDYLNNEIEALIGSEHADTLTGDANNNSLAGGDGSDILVGGNGADVFAYNVGGGNDTIQGGNTDSVKDSLEIHSDNGVGLGWQDLWITKSGSDLTIHFLDGSGTTILLDGYEASTGDTELSKLTVYGSSQTHSVDDVADSTTLNQLIQAMADWQANENGGVVPSIIDGSLEASLSPYWDLAAGS